MSNDASQPTERLRRFWLSPWFNRAEFWGFVTFVECMRIFYVI